MPQRRIKAGFFRILPADQYKCHVFLCCAEEQPVCQCTNTPNTHCSPWRTQQVHGTVKLMALVPQKLTESGSCFFPVLCISGRKGLWRSNWNQIAVSVWKGDGLG
uniref:Uncharacterized protein n=1 Tax=Sphaerodactylus townsendi TaxID=933632 RepID=A0ACB8FE73_9SAUR